MEQFRILIVEDETSIAESLKDIIECLNHKVVDVVDNGNCAIEVIENSIVDLILLDIQINGKMDGIELSKLIKEQYDVPFIFTTAFADDKTISKAKEHSPYGYIVKPYGINDINAAMEIALSNYHQMKAIKQSQGVINTHRSNYFYVKSDSRLVKVDIDNLLYIEAKGDYAIFKTEDNSYIVHSTMKNIMNKIDKSRFLKVHRSYIVNLDKIIDIEESNLLINDKVIPISRANKEALNSRINMI